MPPPSLAAFPPPCTTLPPSDVCLERAAQLSANASLAAYDAAWNAWALTEAPKVNADFQVRLRFDDGRGGWGGVWGGGG